MWDIHDVMRRFLSGFVSCLLLSSVSDERSNGHWRFKKRCLFHSRDVTNSSLHIGMQEKAAFEAARSSKAGQVVIILFALRHIYRFITEASPAKRVAQDGVLMWLENA